MSCRIVATRRIRPRRCNCRKFGHVRNGRPLLLDRLAYCRGPANGFVLGRSRQRPKGPLPLATNSVTNRIAEPLAYPARLTFPDTTAVFRATRHDLNISAAGFLGGNRPVGAGYGYRPPQTSLTCKETGRAVEDELRRA